MSKVTITYTVTLDEQELEDVVTALRESSNAANAAGGMQNAAMADRYDALVKALDPMTYTAPELRVESRT